MMDQAENAMAVVCDDHGLLFTHVPQTGASFVTDVLTGRLGGRLVEPSHGTYRRLDLETPPPIRAFSLREPVSWYRAYWVHARSAMTHPKAWPVWGLGDVQHPTHLLDTRCGHRDFAQFVGNVLRAFPNGFLRSLYCDFLNGATHVLRFERLGNDLETLLRHVGCADVTIARTTVEDVTARMQRLEARATLPPRLEQRLRDVENLDGLSIPYIVSVWP
jgi:hypothetical protein